MKATPGKFLRSLDVAQCFSGHQQHGSSDKVLRSAG